MGKIMGTITGNNCGKINISSSFPVFIVDRLDAARRFYADNFGFSPVFESDWYIHLVSPSGVQAGFLVPDHPSQPEFFQKAFTGDGMILSFEVDDVDSAYATAQANGLDVILPVRSEEWGQRHFAVQDPNGVRIDIVQATEISHGASDAHKARYVQ